MIFIITVLAVAMALQWVALFQYKALAKEVVEVLETMNRTQEHSTDVQRALHTRLVALENMAKGGSIRPLRKGDSSS